MRPIKSRRKAKRATKKQQTHMRDSKESRCIPCIVWAEAGNMPIEDVAVENDYNHTKSGNVRRGHDHGYPGCLWHHRGRVEVEGWTLAKLRVYFGPSLAEGSATFHATYGTDDELIARHREEMGLCE